MLLHFHKMNGAGNDFVVIDNRALDKSLDGERIALLCDRHRGVGADGLLAVEPAGQGADFRFRYYNADGGEAEMCGNGARCFARFAARLLPETPDRITFETVAGILSAEMIGENVRVAMSDPEDIRLDVPVNIEELDAPVHSINTGVPHAVAFVGGLDQLDVRRLGAAIRHHDEFAPAGTNVNFVQLIAPGRIAIRTYERGVEDETLACGTGMVACAILHQILHHIRSPVMVTVQGGDTLEVGFEKTGDMEFANVTLTGPADFVFEGEVEI
jgi:diaminopimelate epimerase